MQQEEQEKRKAGVAVSSPARHRAIVGPSLQPTRQRATFLTEQGGLTAGHRRSNRLGEMAGRGRARWRAGSRRELDGSVNAYSGTIAVVAQPTSVRELAYAYTMGEARIKGAGGARHRFRPCPPGLHRRLTLLHSGPTWSVRALL